MRITNKTFCIDFDRDKTQIIKGIAIITMIIHHCISIPSINTWIDMFGAAMKICISYFTFLVGFGYAFSKQKTVAEGLHRSFNLLVQFWLLLFLVFIPLYLIDFDGEISFYQVLVNMFGLESDLHHFSWYLYYYIYAMLVMPYASIIIDRYGWKAVLGLITLTYGWEIIIYAIPNYNANIFTQAIFDCLFNSPLLFLGYYMAKYNIYAKIPLQKKHTFPLIFLFILGIIAAVFKRVFFGFMLDFFYIPVIMFSIVGIFTLYDLKPIRFTLSKLGDMSMPMWFIHAVFIMPFATIAFVTDWTAGNPWLKFSVVAPLSFILALIYDKITKPIVKRI